MVQSSDPWFCMKHHAGVPLVTYDNGDGIDQIVVPKSSKVHELLIDELHVKPLDGHLGAQKLSYALF